MKWTGIVHFDPKDRSAPIHTGKAHVFLVAIPLRPTLRLDRPILHWKQSFQIGATFLKNKNIDLLWQIAFRTELFCRGQSFGGRHQQFFRSFGGDAWLTYISEQA